jgi:hypothetical protein
VLSSSVYDVLLITESWLNETHLSSMFNIYGYKCFRCDRNYSIGGGVMILYKSTISITFSDMLNTDCEFLSVKIACKTYSLMLCIVYRPPSAGANFVNDFETFLSHLNCSKIIVTGDFNFPGIDWNMLKCDNAEGYSFLELCMSFGLQQLVAEPTNNCGNIIDLVFSNIDGLITDLDVNEPFCATCDHNQIVFSVSCNSLSANSHAFKCFSKTDYSKIYELLVNVNWNSLFQNCIDVNERYNRFSCFLNYLIELYVPVYTSRKLRNSIWSDRTKQLYRIHKKHMKMYKCFPTIQNKLRRNTISSEFRRSCRYDRFIHECTLVKSYDKNRFYRFVKHNTKISHNISSITVNGVNVDNIVDICNAFNEYFCSVFTVDNDVIPAFSNCNLYSSIQNVCFDEMLVFNELKKLKSKSSVGIDCIPTCFFEENLLLRFISIVMYF